MNVGWILGSAIVSFAIAAILGKWLVPFLKKLKYGQTILDIGPKWHKGKQGTPTMGGLMFVISTVVTTVVCALLYSLLAEDEAFAQATLMMPRVLAGLAMAVLYGAIGFFDDYIKVVKKEESRPYGPAEADFAVCGRGGVFTDAQPDGRYFTNNYSVCRSGRFGLALLGACCNPDCRYGQRGQSFRWNRRACGFDDVLCRPCVYADCFYACGPGHGDYVGGACGRRLGFLLWNFHPAKVFMGDTGSLYLGGFLCALAFGLNIPIILIPVALVYFCEMFSVMLQVVYFKITHGKRLFKMSPIHHHFEMCGWSEVKIVAVFSTVTAVCGIIALMLVVMGVVR